MDAPNYQVWFNIAILVLGGMAGWWMQIMWTNLKDLEKADRMLVDRVAAIDKLVAGGHLAAGSRVDLVHSGVAVAVPAGAPRPDISSEAAVRDAVRGARTVGFSTGPSGVFLQQLFERWGLAAELEGRLVQAKPGVPVGRLVAEGQCELGFQQLSELMHEPGVDVLGLLPPEIAHVTVFSAALPVRGAQADAVRGWIAFATSADADEAKRRHGMEPA